ncbi:Tic20-like protein [Leptospira broomii serovar Hurstbridge str. 5399]|uniref:Tic20-like protein n=1 Tax=Leptospira broomii serovar Hurstbridge str. 5399 TaxID=1049789 RepID=T0FET5_9LEPT|nr:DUF4870 domain-containing protein [Leptospira broomii]EQA46401.1 Tic20-like protein [Leptospira broomii serovar Hurstbridge str. 5399]
MKYEDLEKLNGLKEKGAISQEEYEAEKKKILETPYSNQNDRLGMTVNQYCMLLHLSLYSVFVFPVVGMLVPLVLWLIEKDSDPEVDAHGKIVVNWLISSLIYGVIFGVLCIVLIGIPFILILGVCYALFPIIGAVKANSGIKWEYPLSLHFLKKEQSQ